MLVTVTEGLGVGVSVKKGVSLGDADMEGRVVAVMVGVLVSLSVGETELLGESVSVELGDRLLFGV